LPPKERGNGKQPATSVRSAKPSVGTNVVNAAFAENSTPGKEQNFLPLARADRNGYNWHRLNMTFLRTSNLGGLGVLCERSLLPQDPINSTPRQAAWREEQEFLAKRAESAKVRTESVEYPILYELSDLGAICERSARL
jgi:hypothetical protein